MPNRVLINEDNTVMLEKRCIAVIEAETEEFFKYCMKSARSFSLVVAKDLKSFTPDMFEEFVLSAGELNDLIDGINSKINKELAESSAIGEISLVNVDLKLLADICFILEKRIREFMITQRAVRISESIIDRALSKSLGSACRNGLADYAAGKVKLGERLLGSNNHRSHAERCRQELYEQIEGMLLNIKLEIKEQLTKECIININEYDIDDSLIA